VLEAYAVFCVLLTIIVTVYIYNPLIVNATNAGIDNSFTRSPNSSLIGMQIVALIGAPIFIYILYVPTARKTFINTLKDKVNTPER
jgi:hypothetical protein